VLFFRETLLFARSGGKEEKRFLSSTPVAASASRQASTSEKLIF
jgi:hypothetical protein